MARSYVESFLHVVCLQQMCDVKYPGSSVMMSMWLTGHGELEGAWALWRNQFKMNHLWLAEYWVFTMCCDVFSTREAMLVTVHMLSLKHLLIMKNLLQRAEMKCLLTPRSICCSFLKMMWRCLLYHASTVQQRFQSRGQPKGVQIHLLLSVPKASWVTGTVLNESE